MNLNHLPTRAAAATLPALRLAYSTALLTTAVLIGLGLLAPLTFLSALDFLQARPALLVPLNAWLGTAWLWGLLTEARDCLGGNPAEGEPAAARPARPVAELLRGTTCGTLLSGALVLFLQLWQPALLHTILTNLPDVNPILLACGVLGLLAGALNYCFGVVPARAVRSAAAAFERMP